MFVLSKWQFWTLFCAPDALTRLGARTLLHFICSVIQEGVKSTEKCAHRGASVCREHQKLSLGQIKHGQNITTPYFLTLSTKSWSLFTRSVQVARCCISLSWSVTSSVFLHFLALVVIGEYSIFASKLIYMYFALKNKQKKMYIVLIFIFDPYYIKGTVSPWF